MKKLEEEWNFFVYWLAWNFFRPMVKRRCIISGTEHIPRPDKCRNGLIVVARHVNYSDIPAIACQFPAQQPVHFLTKAELYKFPVLGWLCRKGFTIPIRRLSQTPSEDEIKKAASMNLRAYRIGCVVLKNAQTICIFMEGGIGRKEVKESPIRFAKKTGALFLPVYIEEIEQGISMPLWDGFSIGKYKLIFRKPCALHDLGSDGEDTSVLAERLIDRIYGRNLAHA